MNSQSHPRIYPLLVNLIYRQSKIGILATVVNASILVFILWEQITHWILTLWYIIILLVSLIRYILNKRFLGQADPSQDIRRWGQLLKVGLAISGLLWGATGIFLFPVHSIAHQVFIAFVIAGMVAGAVGVFSPIMPIFLAFSIPALVPITIRCILISDQMHMAMGAMITLFAILTFMTAQRIGFSTRELVALKETFVDQLEERTADLERVNETLEQRVAERTRQLQALAMDLVEAEERERRRLAQLLHDDLQQSLAAARMQLQAACECTPADTEALANVEKIMGESLQKARRLSHELSPAVLQHSGLVASLEWLARQMKEQFGLHVQMESDGAQQFEGEPLKVFFFRAVQELLFNMVKHAGVKTAQVALSSSDSCAVVSVTDQGQGFDPGILDSITSLKGFGLLSLRERTRYIGGSLAIESAAGKGSRFTLTVPISLAKAEKRDDPATDLQASTPTKSPVSADAGGSRVLFVDDHHVMRQGLIKLMSGQPVVQVVGEAANGQEAIEKVRELRPDVVVMDVSMPVMDGIEATRRIKAGWPEVRVVGLSMYDDDQIAQRMREAGAEAFLSKTASSAELLKAIYGTTRKI
jgi:signal transduction histidine kinase